MCCSGGTTLCTKGVDVVSGLGCDLLHVVKLSTIAARQSNLLVSFNICFYLSIPLDCASAMAFAVLSVQSTCSLHRNKSDTFVPPRSGMPPVFYAALRRRMPASAT